MPHVLINVSVSRKHHQEEGQDGEKKYTTEIHVVDMTFLTTKKELDTKPSAGKKSEPISSTNIEKSSKEKDDDLPF